MNSLSNSESALDKFAKKIDFANLTGNPADFYKAGLAFVENSQFDDGIIEFVKIIKTVSHQDSLFVNAVKELMSMGFSIADISAITNITEFTLESTTIHPPSSAPPETAETNYAPVSFWNNRKQKLRSLFLIALAVLVLTLPYSIYSIFIIPIIIFPVGLIGLVFDLDNYSLLALPLWVIYLLLATKIISNTQRKDVVVMYIILISLLLLNIVGCHAVAPTIMEGVH